MCNLFILIWAVNILRKVEDLPAGSLVAKYISGNVTCIRTWVWDTCLTQLGCWTVPGRFTVHVLGLVCLCSSQLGTTHCFLLLAWLFDCVSLEASLWFFHCGDPSLHDKAQLWRFLVFFSPYTFSCWFFFFGKYEWGVFTPRTAGLSEHVAFVCLGYGLPGRRLLIRGRYCWMVCQGDGAQGRLWGRRDGSAPSHLPSLPSPALLVSLPWGPGLGGVQSLKFSPPLFLFLPLRSLTFTLLVYFRPSGLCTFFLKENVPSRRESGGKL